MGENNTNKSEFKGRFGTKECTIKFENSSLVIINDKAKDKKSATLLNLKWSDILWIHQDPSKKSNGASTSSDVQQTQTQTQTQTKKIHIGAIRKEGFFSSLFLDESESYLVGDNLKVDVLGLKEEENVLDFIDQVKARICFYPLKGCFSFSFFPFLPFFLSLRTFKSSRVYFHDFLIRKCAKMNVRN